MTSSQPRIVDSSDDDLPVPIMHFSVITDALQEGQEGSPPRQTDIEVPPFLGTTDDASIVRSSRLYEQINEMGQSALTRKSHSKHSERVPTNRVVRLRARIGEGERWNNIRTTSCIEYPLGHEKSEQSAQQSPKESFTQANISDSDTERNKNAKVLCQEAGNNASLAHPEGQHEDEDGGTAMMGTVGTESSSPQIMGRYHATPINETLNSSRSTRLSGTSLRRPARRYKRMPSEAKAVLDGDFISHADTDVPNGNLVTEKDVQDSIKPQVQICPLQESRQHTECLQPYALLVPIHHESPFPVINGRMDELPKSRPAPPSIYSRETELSPTLKRTQEVSKRPLTDKSAEDHNHEVHEPPSLPARPSVPPKMTVLDTATTAAGAAATSRGQKKRNMQFLNNKLFKRLDCIGRGGSARVYRVMEENCTIRALKKVSLRDVDEVGIKGLKGEIDLLRKLGEVERVVKLFDWEFNDKREDLSLLMECGEMDLDKVLKTRIDAGNTNLDLGFTRYHWKEMLECVAAVHAHGIVHSDLKPANFLLVNGRLKLIDFGIANMIQDNTVNVHRENQVGTPNYMAPETLLDSNVNNKLPTSEGKLMKLGKPSDIWSLGCILYLMVYGTQPFGNIQGAMQKALAITNPRHVIPYAATGIGGIEVPSVCIRTLKACLTWDQHQRPTVQALLAPSNEFLYPDYVKPQHAALTQDSLATLVWTVIKNCEIAGIPTEEEMASRSAGLFNMLSLTSTHERPWNPGQHIARFSTGLDIWLVERPPRSLELDDETPQ